MKKEFAIVIAAVILLSVLTIVPINSQVIAGNEICFHDSAYSSYSYAGGLCPNSVIMREKTISPSDKFEISSSSITNAKCKESDMGIMRKRVEIKYEYCIRALPTCPPGTYSVTGQFDFDCIPSSGFVLSPNLYSHTITVEPNKAPSACFTVSPSEGDLDTIFNVDASCSSDLKDSIAALQVRWDWENDGIYDTSYSTTKIAAHQYTTIGIKTIKLQVKDTDGNTHTTKKTVIAGDIDFSGIGNIKLYLTSNLTDEYLSENIGRLTEGYHRLVSNGDSCTWGYYYLNDDIKGTSYSYWIDLTSGYPDRTSELSTTFKIEININGITVATFPLITVQYDPKYQPQTFSGTVTGLDPTTSSGDEVALKITRISGDIGTIYYGSSYGSYITIPPLAMQTIQSKIDAANLGDTIIIEDGIYNENVKVNKQLTIRSKNGPDKTIVQAATPEDPVFNVSAGHVDISGFTVKGADTGIYLYNVDYCNISGNNCSSNDVYGIDLLHSNNNSIFNNTCSNNNFGIYLNNSSNNLITNNNISNNSRVFPFDFPPSQGTGIYLLNSSNNKIYLNNFINNYDNVHPSDLTNILKSTERITYGYRGTTYTNNLGNYWGDYEEKYPDAEEIDATGIWDTPYSINGDKDNYPLKDSFENYLLDFVSHSSALNVSVTVAIEAVAPENYSQVTVRVTTTEGTPLSDVSVNVSATGGSLSPTSGTTDSKGEFKSTYRAPSITTTQTYTISATASKAGYISGSGTATITVKTLPQSETVIIPSWEDPLVKIENQANRDVTVTFTGPTSATIYLEPGTTESQRFMPGVYSIHATATGASPATIPATLSKGYMYTLRIFEIVIRLP